VLVFRDQELTPQQQLSFGLRFGAVHQHPYIRGLEECPDIIEVVREPTDTHCFGNLWHTDQIFVDTPPSVTILHAQEVPDVGGDTMFSNMHRAYTALSKGVRDMLCALRTHNVGDAFKQLGGKSREERYKNRSSMDLRSPGTAQTFAEHPLVRVHPETGRPALFFGFHTQRFANWTEEESEPLLAFLRTHIARPEFTCRVRWRSHTLVTWDNRCSQHVAIDDYFGQRRRMRRLTIRGERPSGVIDA
jgi:taurine dioxygenase